MKTFRLPEPPQRLLAGGRVPAEAIQDHALRFLTYEGPVQSGKGSVKREADGNYETRFRDDNLWEIRMQGALLKGVFQMKREGDKGWSFGLLAEGGDR